MALSEVNFQVKDGSLGIIGNTGEQVQIKMGVATGLTPNTLYSFADLTAMKEVAGLGPGPEAVAAVLAAGGGPCFCMPLNPSQFGYSGSVTRIGTGAATITISHAPHQTILITISTGGTLGNGAFTWKVGTGPTSAPVTLPAGSTFRVPGTFCVITFPAGTYVLGENYTVNTDGTIVRAGGTTGPAITQQSSPIDVYEPKLKVVLGGANGTWQFQFALDAQDPTGDDSDATYGALITSPSGGVYVIENTGLVLTFSGTFVANDYYYWKSGPASYNATDVNNAFTALIANNLSSVFAWIHLVHHANSASGAASLYATLATNVATLFTKFKFVRAFLETPSVGSVVISGTAAIADTADTDSTIVTAFVSSADVRMGVGAGDCKLTSVYTGIKYRRNALWPIMARCGAVTPGEDGAHVALGNLVGVTKLFRDEASTPLLDAVGFNTLRTITGKTGFFITGTKGGPGVKMKTSSTSDYYRFANGRVMDLACSIAREVAVDYLQGNVRVNATTGFILEEDALEIEAKINGKLKAAIVSSSPPNASASTVRVSRTTNILSTQSLPIEVRVTPLAYIGDIVLTIGFTNPALQTAQAA